MSGEQSYKVSRSGFHMPHSGPDWLRCQIHGHQGADFLEVGEHVFCLHCCAEASGYEPWFYTGSLFGKEIIDLGIGEIVGPLA